MSRVAGFWETPICSLTIMSVSLQARAQLYSHKCRVEMVCWYRVVSIDVTVVLLMSRPRQSLLNIPKLFAIQFGRWFIGGYVRNFVILTVTVRDGYFVGLHVRIETLPGGWTVQSIQQPVPSLDKRGWLVSGRASGHKTFAINRNAETVREYE